jgi:hypothetical protein
MSKNLNKPPIGKLQYRILVCLAQNKDITRNQIAAKIDEDLSNVVSAIEKRDNGYIEQSGEIEVKGSKRPIYKLSNRGAAFILAYSEDSEIIKQTTKNYETLLTPGQSGLFSAIEAELSNWEITRKLLRMLGHSYLLYGSITLDNATRSALLSKGMFTPKEQKELARIIPKFQLLKTEVQTARDQLDAVLRGDA